MINSQKTQHVSDEEGTNPTLLFEQVMTQMADRCIQTGLMTKNEAVLVLEDLIQQIERDTLTSAIHTA